MVCKQYNVNIIVTSNVENKSYETELTEDLISILHHFSMKSYSNRRKFNKLKQELKEIK
jgi:predicted site-specific integrase-resolvase